jgi:hypothetical protein
LSIRGIRLDSLLSRYQIRSGIDYKTATRASVVVVGTQGAEDETIDAAGMFDSKALAKDWTRSSVAC